MKILIPIFGFSKEGGFRVISQLANYWLKNGHEVEFIVFNNASIPYFPTNAKIQKIDKNGLLTSEIDQYSLDVFRSIFLLRKGINQLKNHYDIVLATYSLTTYSILGSKNKAKRFYYIQAYEPEMFGMMKGKIVYILQFLSWLSYFLPFTRIVNSDLYRRYKNIKSDFIVMPGIDLSVFYPKKIISSPILKIGCIGRIERHKGTIYILEAFIKLVETYPSMQLIVAFGDITNEALHSNIKVINPKNDNELADFYRDVDIIVTGSFIQLGAIHYPVIESMACNTPVINCGYYPSNHENSWIVTPKDSNSIYNAILEIINNNAKAVKKSKLALSTISQFEWEIVSSKMIYCFKF